ncbi:hypothetical protein H633G_11530 [Metarhizium anisopliae BRIP 53284]|nr:hypothetical protein H633G_11530 [Metarhizium anisopliae BRIP 53284]
MTATAVIDDMRADKRCLRPPSVYRCREEKIRQKKRGARQFFSAYCTVDCYCRRGCQPHPVAWIDLSAVEEICRGLAPAAGTYQLYVVMAKPFMVVGKITMVVSGSKEVMRHWPGEV